MRIEDFTGTCLVSGRDQIDQILCKRYGEGVNEFWISHEGKEHPVIALLVKNELATLQYFPKERHPGFASRGNLAGLSPAGQTIFSINSPAEPTPVNNEQIISFSDALRAVHEFAANSALPKCIQWDAL